MSNCSFQNVNVTKYFALVTVLKSLWQRLATHTEKIAATLLNCWTFKCDFGDCRVSAWNPATGSPPFAHKHSTVKQQKKKKKTHNNGSKHDCNVIIFTRSSLSWCARAHRMRSRFPKCTLEPSFVLWAFSFHFVCTMFPSRKNATNAVRAFAIPFKKIAKCDAVWRQSVSN